MHLPFDTPFDPEFPVYTRANADEILPHVLSPLAWSLVGPGFEEAFRITFCDDMNSLPRPGPEIPWMMVGRFAGRFHLNLSAIRTAGDRLPGTSAGVMDVQFLGDAAATGLPRHEKHADDRRWLLKATPSMGRTMAGLGRRVDRDAAAVAACTEEVRDLVRSGAPAPALARQLRVARGLFGRVAGTHVTARLLSAPVLEQAVHAVTRAGVEPSDVLRYVAGIPQLESARPARALVVIARGIDEGSPLAELVREGSWAALTGSSLPGAEHLAARLGRFLDEFGHRGVGEFDPTVPVWEQRPDDVVRLVSSLVGAAAPSVDHDELLDPGRLARPLVAAARSAMQRGERTKDASVRAAHAMRILLWTLGERWARTLPPDRLRLCTVDELEDLALGAGVPADAELDRRAASLSAAEAVDVAQWSDGTLRLGLAGAAPELDGSPPLRWPLDPAEEGAAPAGDVAADRRTTLRGIGGSPGVAIGRVRVLDAPYGRFDEGEVLVARVTDTAWTPLFLLAAAVVTEVGGVLSHATIVARDFSVPAVVGVEGAATRLRDGDEVEVDGGAGTVRILSR